jgi:aminomethyltransferase
MAAPFAGNVVVPKFAPEKRRVSASTETLLTTPLHALHLELGARMVPFAGYSMPVQYPAGLMAEHHHTRRAAGLFDVSHMGQLRLVGADAAAAFETLMPVDVIDLPVGKQRYGLLLTDQGIMDDLMFVNRGTDLFVIVNGACKAGDIAHIQARIGARCAVHAHARPGPAGAAGAAGRHRPVAPSDRAWTSWSS